MKGLGHDIRYALRQIHKSPGFALAVILTLALGIGVNTAVFSMVNGFLLRPLPYPQPERLGVLMLHREGTNPGSGKTSQNDEDSQDGDTWNLVRDNVPAVQEASYGLGTGVNLQAGADVRYVQEMRVSSHYFEVLGLPLLFGREFNDNEDRHGGPPAVILSYALWKSAFQGDRHVIGSQIHLKGEPYSVVGVLPPHAQATQIADVWTPLQPAPTGECGGENCGIILRLAPGATWQQANAQLSHLRKPWFSELETKYRGRAWFYPAPFSRQVGHEDERTPVLVLMLAVSFILLIACANLAGLTLVRVGRRAPEIATRLALGTTRWLILRQFWVENLILAMIGAGVGLSLAYLILRSLSGFLPDEYIPLGGLSIDPRVLAFTFGTSLLTSILFGTLPALQTRKVDVRSSMAAGGRSITGSSSRLRQFFIAAEVALTVVLLAGAGLLSRTLIHLETQRPGFDAHNVITAKVSLDDARYHDANAFHNLLDKSVGAMRQIPGVEYAAVGLSLPYERGLNDSVKFMDGKLKTSDAVQTSNLTYITPDYFQTLRIPILLGRNISPSDVSTSELVTAVNEDFVHAYFTEPNPIGRHIRTEGQTYTIVGIVGSVVKKPSIRANSPMDTEPILYVPAAQLSQGLVNMAHVWYQPSWTVRTSKPLEGITGAMQKAMSSVDPTLPFSGFYSMDDLLAENLKLQRIEVLLLGTLAGLALLLSAVGIYGLVSNLVVQRTREIGIRLALGAPLREVISKVGGSGVIASAAGLIVGLMLAAVSLRVLQSQLYGVRMYDPVTLTTVPVLLMLVAVAASLIPALRISRIDPAKTLRAE